jgi:hypothetical protein
MSASVRALPPFFALDLVLTPEVNPRLPGMPGTLWSVGVGRRPLIRILRRHAAGRVRGADRRCRHPKPPQTLEGLAMTAEYRTAVGKLMHGHMHVC